MRNGLRLVFVIRPVARNMEVPCLLRKKGGTTKLRDASRDEDPPGPLEVQHGFVREAWSEIHCSEHWDSDLEDCYRILWTRAGKVTD